MRDESILHECLTRDWSLTEREQLTHVALAIQSPLAGQFILDYLDRSAVEGDRLTELLQHAARNLPQDRAEQLAHRTTTSRS